MLTTLPVGIAILLRVGLALTIMTTTVALALRQLNPAKWWVGLALLAGILPTVTAGWLGLLPSLHAGLVGSLMLIAAAVVAEGGDHGDAARAWIIGAAFLGLWTWEAMEVDLNAAAALLPVVPIVGVLILTGTRVGLSQPARALRQATEALWMLAAGCWFTLTLLTVLSPVAWSLPDLAGVAGMPPRAVMSAVALACVLLVSIPALTSLTHMRRHRRRCPADGRMAYLKLDLVGTAMRGYDSQIRPSVRRCTRRSDSDDCEGACLEGSLWEDRVILGRSPL